MLYNINKKKIRKTVDCQTCEYFDKKQKKCLGIGKCCFEYDERTQTCIDPITRLAIKF